MERRGQALVEPVRQTGASSDSTSNRLEQDGVVENSAVDYWTPPNCCQALVEPVRQTGTSSDFTSNRLEQDGVVENSSVDYWTGDSRFRRTTVGKMLLLAKKRFFSMLFATFDANYWRPYITRLSTVISSCGLCVDV